MKTYKELLQKKINVEFNGMILNSYKLTEIRPTERFMVGLEGQGRMYNCSVDWANKNIDGAYPTMDFDEQTLDGLADKGLSVCPMMPNLVYRCEGKEKMN